MAKAPFIASQKLHSTGSSHGITIPVEWFENNGLDQKSVKELVVVGNENLLVLNPNNAMISELKGYLTKKVITLKQLEKIMGREVVF